MKNFLYCIFFMFVLNFSYAQTEKSVWPFGCRVHHITVGVYSTDLTLCCSPTAWSYPGISCFELKTSNGSNVYQYIMIDELEVKSGKKIVDNQVEISSENPIVDDKNDVYGLKKDMYSIELNDKKERFVRVLFEKKN